MEVYSVAAGERLVPMDFPLTLVDLVGSVALLLWGIHMVQTGVQRAFGAKLRGFLGNALRNRCQAFLAGMGVTALLQSSTATGLMITGFAAGGLSGGRCVVKGRGFFCRFRFGAAAACRRPRRRKARAGWRAACGRRG